MDDGVIMTTPEGRFNLSTPQGAEAFLAAGPATLITTNADQLKDNSLPKLHRVRIIQTWGILASSLSPESLARVPAAEKECLVETAAAVLAAEAKRPKWRSDGELSLIGKELFDTLTPWCKDVAVVQLLLAGGSKGPLGQVCGMCREAEPGPCFDFAETFLHTVHNCAINLSKESYPRYEKLYQTGALEQVMRMGLSREARRMPEPARIIDYVRRDNKLVRKRFAPDTPGDALVREVLADPASRSCPELRSALMQLLQQAILAQDSGVCKMMCRNCGRTGEDMKKCARCQQAEYCSRECQKADWKAHKPTCREADGKVVDHKSVQSFLAHVFHSQIEPIKFALGSKAMLVQEEIGSRPPVKDLVILLDQSEPNTRPKIAYVHDLLSRKEDMPAEWFHKGTEVYENIVRAFLGALKEQHSRMQHGQVITAVRSFDSAGVYRFQPASEQFSVHEEDISGPSMIDSMVRMLSLRAGNA